MNGLQKISNTPAGATQFSSLIHKIVLAARNKYHQCVKKFVNLLEHCTQTTPEGKDEIRHNDRQPIDQAELSKIGEEYTHRSKLAEYARCVICYVMVYALPRLRRSDKWRRTIPKLSGMVYMKTLILISNLNKEKRTPADLNLNLQPLTMEKKRAEGNFVLSYPN